MKNTVNGIKKDLSLLCKKVSYSLPRFKNQKINEVRDDFASRLLETSYELEEQVIAFESVSNIFKKHFSSKGKA